MGWHAVAMETRVVLDACFVQEQQKPEIHKLAAAAAGFIDSQRKLQR